MDDESVSRRDVVSGAGRAALAAMLSGAFAGRTLATPIPRSSLSRTGTPPDAAGGRLADRSPEAVFPQSVASGDPTPAGAVLWTRVAPSVHRPDAALFLDVRRSEPGDSSGESFAEGTRYRVDPSAVTTGDHTVRVDLDGALDPDATYRYRFEYDGARSRIGRCRTLPATDSSPDRLRLAVLTCQDYRAGRYGAYRYVADSDVDFLVHLGDFIYETAGISPHDGREIELPSGDAVAMGLDDYRHLHRTYRSDPNLRRALRRHTLIATWDDHEIVNDRYWDYEEDVPATDDHPRADDPEFLTGLFADGIQAWWEYMPTRATYDADAEHLHDRLRLWRSFRFGDLAELLVTDERLFRSAPPAAPGEWPISLASGDPTADPDRTMLGDAQGEWFRGRLRETDATWTAWANEVLNMSLRLSVDDETLYNVDAWDGYEGARRRFTAALRESGVDNFVALTGDMHAALAGTLRERYPVDEDEATDLDGLGVEFMAPAVTSTNLARYLDLPEGPVAEEAVEHLAIEENPHLAFFNAHRWGYATVEFTPESCTYTAYAVEKDVDPAAAEREAFKRLRVSEGSTELRDVTRPGW